MKNIFASSLKRSKVPAAPNLFVNKASLSGSLLTSLVQEVATLPEDEDLEGFLFGGKIDHKKQVTTDFEDRREVVETEISFQSYISMGDRGTFYDDKGYHDPEKLSSIQSTAWVKGQEMVGWMVVRKNTGLSPSLRDAAVHTSLSNSAGPEKPWLLLIVNIELGEGQSTQGITYRCLQHSCATPPRARFDPVHMEVKNASYNAHDDYTNFSGGVLSMLNDPQTVEMMSNMSRLYKSYPPLHVQEQERMFDAVMERIDGLVQEVIEKEKDLCHLQEEHQLLETL